MSDTESSPTETCHPTGRTSNGSARALWHESAPAAVRKAFSSGQAAAGWEAWKGHLAERDGPVAVAELLPGDDGGLGWALPDGLDQPPEPAWLDRSDSSVEKELLRWLGESAGTTGAEAYALQAIACGRALPRLAEVLAAEVWWDLLDHLIATATEAAGSGPDDLPLEENPLLHQLLCGELALTLAYLFPEIRPCRSLRSAARRALSAGLVDLLDGEGLPHAKHLCLLRPLLACWTRCRAVGGGMKGRCWSKAAAGQYEWLMRHTLRLARHDGTHVFSDGSSGVWDATLLEAALQFGGNKVDRQIASVVLPRPWNRDSGKIDERDLPEPANHSEWAGTTVLRRRWARPTEQLTVLYDRPALRIELECGKDVIFSGVWQLEVRRDGELLVPEDDWEEVCWISDEDADYLELEIGLSGGAKLQRSMLLAREDRFLLLSDAVLSDRPGTIEYRGSLPLCLGMTLKPHAKAREGLLVGSKRRASVLPLALPEWRAEKRVGELLQTDDGLQLRQTQSGGRLFAPLLFDLDRRRHGRKLTWRPLTVAESLEVQPPEVAVGYRVALGRRQWLIYRSLAARANRTLLGHNLSSEMLVARFDPSGEVEPLVEIE